MFSDQRPSIVLSEGLIGALQAPAVPLERIPSAPEVSNMVAAAIATLSSRLTGSRFEVSPTVSCGSKRVVLTVRALDSDDAFVVKAADRGLGFSVGLSGNPASAAAQMEWMTKYLALEQAVRCEESAWRITVAPLVKGETVLDYISRRGLSDDDWKLGMQGIPTLMRAIWRHARSPIDPSLGLLLDHHFDNILVGFKQPPFQDDERGARARVVFVDQRDDGLYHPESTLEDALSDYLRIFKGNAYLRNS